jgi:hypothetical protein
VVRVCIVAKLKRQGKITHSLFETPSLFVGGRTIVSGICILGINVEGQGIVTAGLIVLAKTCRICCCVRRGIMLLDCVVEGRYAVSMVMVSSTG